MTETRIRCGNRQAHDERTYHASIESVRRCFSTETTWACTWLREIDTEDGPGVTECGALSWNTARGYECEHGHDHVYDEVRAKEGWDYAADPDEAGLLAGRGVHPVAMDGTGITINPDAMRYAMSL